MDRAEAVQELRSRRIEQVIVHHAQERAVADVVE
jgi:hypothetical protein